MCCVDKLTLSFMRRARIGGTQQREISHKSQTWKTKRYWPGNTGPTKTESNTWSCSSLSALPTYVSRHSKSARELVNAPMMNQE